MLEVALTVRLSHTTGRVVGASVGSGGRVVGASVGFSVGLTVTGCVVTG